ncbi:beta-1,4-mannosyltransferase [Nocardioides zeae]|uniref:Beta-1,4-mannosyltransferase n=1 Tax=Nocardioides zeae TaxID=1457234 RepID=A0ACC6INJ8_9ACTN|nr:glycosyltransferase family 1 protein [Nocardioides zeae]MDR6173738.1 beta-1,4-mannosyltransferase [Nocardioides zeae]MDR6212232.1 beta-1,4-mannosyltransferase [Nocardioides zeae]
MTVTPEHPPAPDRRLVVASVPADHAYVRHLAPLDRPGPVRLDDPPGEDEHGVPTGHWWPPVLLDAARTERVDADVLHVHFGFEGRTPAQLEELVATLRRTGRALVLTVHDLHNPHLTDRTAHLAQLGVLVPAADGLVTLTAGAAAEVERRWGRTPVVVPHPHVVPLDEMPSWQSRRRPRRPGEPVRVGVSLKSLRPNVAAVPVLEGLLAAVPQVPGTTLEVAVHRDVLAPEHPRHDPAVVALLERAATVPGVEVRVHDYLDDAALHAQLVALDVSVLPYRFGTHSGWLEMCRDLGTDVLAPDLGYYADQGPVDVYRHAADGSVDVGSLVAALEAVRDRGPRPPITVAERERQRQEVAVAHDAVYARAVRRAAERVHSH